MIRGKVWRFGDHVNTDLIIAGRYLDNYDISSLASHVMEDLDPDFASRVQKGDIIVAGRNFGCGSSREQAPLALREAGVSAVVAESFSRIFYRNSINVGLVLVTSPEASSIEEGTELSIDLRSGSMEAEGQEMSFAPLPDSLLEILEAGGLVPWMRTRTGP